MLPELLHKPFSRFLLLKQEGAHLRPFALFFKDGRHFQIVFLTVFLLYGIFALGWETEILKYLVTGSTCFLVQWFFMRGREGDHASLKSAWISALSLSLMLHANAPFTYFLAAVLSIASKFIIRYKGKHVFNPTNFGIVVTILVTGDAWIAPGQWGSNGQLLFLIGIAGFAVVMKVKRLNTALAFLGTFLALGFIRNICYLGWPLDFFTHQLTSGTLLLFTFFMITDPRSTPDSPVAQVLWASLIGAAAFLMSSKLLVHAAPVWALFFLSPLTILFDRIFKSKTFNWK